MFVSFLKIVRALLCALTLTLIGAGGHDVRVETSVSRDASDWSASKRGKPVLSVAIRGSVTCPSAVAAQEAGERAAAATAWMIFPSRIDVSEGFAWRMQARDPERHYQAPNGVRLLI